LPEAFERDADESNAAVTFMDENLSRVSPSFFGIKPALSELTTTLRGVRPAPASEGSKAVANQVATLVPKAGPGQLAGLATLLSAARIDPSSDVAKAVTQQVDKRLSNSRPVELAPLAEMLKQVAPDSIGRVSERIAALLPQANDAAGLTGLAAALEAVGPAQTASVAQAVRGRAGELIPTADDARLVPLLDLLAALGSRPPSSLADAISQRIGERFGPGGASNLTRDMLLTTDPRPKILATASRLGVTIDTSACSNLFRSIVVRHFWVTTAMKDADRRASSLNVYWGLIEKNFAEAIRDTPEPIDERLLIWYLKSPLCLGPMRRETLIHLERQADGHLFHGNTWVLVESGKFQNEVRKPFKNEMILQIELKGRKGR
jgi:hypothetical protein